MVTSLDLLNHGVKFFSLASIDDIRKFCSDHLFMRRNNQHIEFVDLFEFSRLGISGTCHPSQLFIHAEIILDCNSRQGLVLLANVHALFRFNRLMEPVRPAASRHEPSGEFIHDDNFPLFDDVIDVALEGAVGLEGLIDVVEGVDMSWVIEVADAEQTLHLGHPGLRQR